MAEAKPSYLADFLQSPANVSGVLAGGAVAVLLSFPFGLIGAALPLLVTAGVEAIACLFVPDSASFRFWADSQRKKRARAEMIERLVEEIRRRCDNQNQFRQLSDSYLAVQNEVDGLVALAEKRQGVLGLEDLERIANVPGEYLGQQLSLLVMDERVEAINLRDVARKIEQLERQIDNPEPGADVRQLERAKAEYEALINRHQRMLSKRPAIEAALVALPDQLAEIYQMLTTELPSGDGERLSGAISRLRLRQDIEAEISEELTAVMPDLRPAKPLQAARAAALKQR